MTGRWAVRQVVDTLAPCSAVSNCLRSMHDILRANGIRAGVAARAVEPGATVPRSASSLTSRVLWLYHFSIGSPLTAEMALRARGQPLVLWYHNLTPSRYFRASDPFLAARLAAGREELRRLAVLCRGAIADSEYNAAELREMGCRDVRVVPPLVLDARYSVPPSSAVLDRHDDGRPAWLCVGRLAPNKRQEAVIDAFLAYRRLAPEARLFLVGAEEGSRAYRRWLENQIGYLGLQGVHVLGQVTQDDLHVYYRLATQLVSLSEHEGFGVPLIEAMYFGVPVIAYAAAAVPETMAGAGLLVREPDPYWVAEGAHLLDQDRVLREAVVARQRRRAADFAPEAVAPRLLDALAQFAEGA